jgi:hypothetical protein
MFCCSMMYVFSYVFEIEMLLQAYICLRVRVHGLHVAHIMQV